MFSAPKFLHIAVGTKEDLVARGIEVKQYCLADCYVLISKCSQFRHADCVDILMILLAIMLSLISGLTVPVEAYLTRHWSSHECVHLIQRGI